MRRRTFVLIFCLVVGAGLAGCATAPPPVAQTPPPAAGAEEGWWYARFPVTWPEDEQPRWAVDLALAHAVVGPVLAAQEEEIRLWRFHRRAARDAAGHQLSFIFFGSRELAARLARQLEAQPALAELRERGLVGAAKFDAPTGPLRPEIEATSDPNWSAAVAKSWPYFIMGVSRMWLELIELHAADAAAPEQDLLARYRRIGESLDRLWAEQGQHAFLHHLNAIFGYKPLVITERRQVVF